MGGCLGINDQSQVVLLRSFMDPYIFLYLALAETFHQTVPCLRS
jgi:hypothetical protein